MSWMLFVALGCTPEPEPVDPGPEPEELVMPPIDGIDLPQAWSEMLSLALEVRLQTAWQGQLESLELRRPGCPDLYAGVSPEQEMDMDAGGMSWSDRCQAGTLGYSGWTHWDSALEVIETETDRTASGTRALQGDAVVTRDGELLYELKGQGEDSLLEITGEAYRRWVYSSTLDATVTGTLPFAGSATPEGWRTDLYMSATGGDADRLELRGNVFFFTPMVAERFDSINVDIELVGPTGAGPDSCLEEPLGFISLRDADAFWYDLVFQPRDGSGSDTGYENEPYSGCDGCGTLYVRGVEQAEPVCLDLSWIWSGALQPPAAEEFVYSLRETP